MAGINYLKSIGTFFRANFVMALATGLAAGAIGMGYGTMKGDPEAAYNALLLAGGCMALTYVLKAITRH